MNIERYNAYMRYIVDNTPPRPFSIRTMRDGTEPNMELRNAIVELSNLKYAKDRREVDAMIRERAQIGDVVGVGDAVTNATAQGAA